MSGLLHLIEAATSLSHLVGRYNPSPQRQTANAHDSSASDDRNHAPVSPASAPHAFAQSPAPPDASAVMPRRISDDAAARTKTASTLRENHLLALRASAASERVPRAAVDDATSVSSASTAGTRRSAPSAVAPAVEKRPSQSSAVTVSTAGVASAKSSLPLKKRKGGWMDDFRVANGIPSTISHKSRRTGDASTSSIAESDVTSDGGSACSSDATKNSSQADGIDTAASGATAEDVAMEALARHFREQQRAFALASLMENNCMALRAAGMDAGRAVPAPAAPSGVRRGSSSRQHPDAHVATATTGVITPAQSVPKEKVPSGPVKRRAAPTPFPSSAEAAKSALYQAYLLAITNSTSSS